MFFGVCFSSAPLTTVKVGSPRDLLSSSRGTPCYYRILSTRTLHTCEISLYFSTDIRTTTVQEFWPTCDAHVLQRTYQNADTPCVRNPANLRVGSTGMQTPSSPHRVYAVPGALVSRPPPPANICSNLRFCLFRPGKVLIALVCGVCLLVLGQAAAKACSQQHHVLHE